MLLPNREKAYIPPEKLSRYLLSDTHALGREKARFFKSHGYSQDNVSLLEQGLLTLAREGTVLQEVVSVHGIKYVVQGSMITPQGRVISVRTVWIIEPGDESPRFVTAFPAREVKR